jgi:hypothetical protein
MIELGGMASQARFDLAQTSGTAQLPIQHRDQVLAAAQAAFIRVGLMFLHKPIELRPRNVLQEAMKNAILVRHDVAPFSCPVDSQPSGTE